MRVPATQKSTHSSQKKRSQVHSFAASHIFFRGNNLPRHLVQGAFFKPRTLEAKNYVRWKAGVADGTV